MIRRIISIVICVIMCVPMFAASAVYENETMLGLGKANRISSALSGAVEYTPAEYQFEYAGKKFALLDTREKNEKTYYLVYADDNYGMRAFHIASDTDRNHVWSVTDENKIGYWLNNEFISEDYEEDKLPQGIIENIDYTNVWHTEPTNVENFTTEESMLAESGIALMSVYEYRKYNGMFGCKTTDGNTGAWLRTARASGVSATTSVQFINGIGTTNAVGSNNDSYRIRPIFWLSEDFFKNYKIESPGNFVIRMLDSSISKDEFIESVYSEDEINAWFKAPTATITEFGGSAVVDKTLSVDYSFNSETGFGEGNSFIQWYRCASEDGTYDPIDNSNAKNYTLTDDDAGMYIKVSVTPKSEGNINNVGPEKWSDTCIGPIFGETQIEDAIGDIDDASSDSVLKKLEFYNDIFGLDLSFRGYSEEEKENVLVIFAHTPLSDSPESVNRAFNQAQALAKINYANTSDILGLLGSDALELNLENYSELNDKSSVADALYDKNFTSVTQLETLFYPAVALQIVNEADISNITEALLLCDEYLSEDIAEFDLVELRAIGSMVMDEYEDITELDVAVTTAVQKFENAFKNEEMLGLTFAGRISSAIEGAVEETPEKYRFKYEGKNFVFLDSKDKNGKKYYLVFADDVYGATRPFHNVESDFDHVWSVTDENKIGYWLNSEFISKGYEGEKLPQAIIDNIDWTNIWHTEPVKNISDYSNEKSMLTMSGVSLMSQTEFRKYNGMFGTDVGVSWLRSARSSDVAATTTVLLIYSPPGTTNAAGSATSYSVRPIFWLSEDFFKENKLQSAGVFSAINLDNRITREDLTAILYTEEEINNWFKKPTATINSLSGEAIVGETLAVDYTYSSECGFEESGTVINWYRSSDKISWGESIAQGNTYSLTDADAGMYITASVTPKAVANINPNGDEVRASRIVGTVYSATELQAVIDAIDDITLWTDELIAEKITPHNEVLGLDITFAGLSNEERSEALAIFVNSDISDLTTLRKEFRQSQMLAQLNSKTDEIQIRQILTDERTQLDVTQFNKLKSDSLVISNIKEKDFTKTTDFEKAFYDTVAITRVNEADQTSILSALRDNNDRFTAQLSLMDDYKVGQIGSIILGTYGEFLTLDNAITAAVSVVNSTTTETQTPVDGSDSFNDNFGGGGGGNVTFPSQNEMVVNPPIANPSEDNSIYSDMLSTHWGYEAVKTLSSKGILSGDGNGNFRPEDTLKREEFVKMIVLAFASDIQDKEVVFADVAANAWYAPYIKTAVSNGLINGTGEATFGTGMEISRQDMALIIYRALGSSLKTDKLADFADMDTVSDYAVEAVNALYSAGLLSGDGTNVNPKGSATRAMAAKMVYSAMKYMEGDKK